MILELPALLRVKPEALDRLGIYLARRDAKRVALFWGEGVAQLFGERVRRALAQSAVSIAGESTSSDISEDAIVSAAHELPARLDAIVTIGGGKVIDYCKYLARVSGIPLVAVPTVISNDGFASPLSSLYIGERRQTVASTAPAVVVIDTDVIRHAPVKFFYSGLGDVVAKLTAVHDWKLAFHKRGEPVNDFAALVSLNAVEAVVNYPNPALDDLHFVRVLATSLLMCGVAMTIAGSTRPASGGEHLISHAYDRLCPDQSLHGLQVGVATYCVSWLQETTAAPVRRALERLRFFEFMQTSKLQKREFIEAIRLAPSMKDNFYSILHEPGAVEGLIGFVESDSVMQSLLK